MQIIPALLIVAFFLGSCGGQPNSTSSKVSFEKKETEQKVDVMVNGKLFTSYRWPDSVYKPILYPILTDAGSPLTRGFPISTREGERQDHRHQVGNWFNYGNVNGSDFWGNGSEGKRSSNGGEIKHISIDKLSEGSNEGTMVTSASWLDSTGKELLTEKTEFHFIVKDSVRMIDRVVTLTAKDIPVLFKDTKEGSFGIRVARQLELPSKETVILSDAQGNPTAVPVMSNDNVTGNYRSSEGLTGDSVWGSRAKWVDLYGHLGSEEVSLVICDHPKNPSYPTYWHARGYGLFAANPFGAKDFTKGKEELNYSIAPRQSLTMRYRIIISSGHHLSDAEINGYQKEFADKY